MHLKKLFQKFRILGQNDHSKSKIFNFELKIFQSSLADLFWEFDFESIIWSSSLNLKSKAFCFWKLSLITNNFEWLKVRSASKAAKQDLWLDKWLRSLRNEWVGYLSFAAWLKEFLHHIREKVISPRENNPVETVQVRKINSFKICFVLRNNTWKMFQLRVGAIEAKEALKIDYVLILENLFEMVKWFLLKISNISAVVKV